MTKQNMHVEKYWTTEKRMEMKTKNRKKKKKKKKMEEKMVLKMIYIKMSVGHRINHMSVFDLRELLSQLN